jgi:dephospho-CoA kinase
MRLLQRGARKRLPEKVAPLILIGSPGCEMTTMSNDRGDEAEPVRNGNPERTGSFCARRTLVLGLTGGMATGKTTVAEMLRDLGAELISADDVAHTMLDPGTPVWYAVIREFGDDILRSDRTIDRAKLGEVVFRDAEARRRLEGIVHPPVLDYLSREAKRFRLRGAGVLVLEIPLLVETSSFSLVDKVLVVSAEQETQIRRLEKRSRVSREEAIRRISSQRPMAEKVGHADWVVTTDGTLRSTKQQVSKVWLDIQKLLAQPR